MLKTETSKSILKMVKSTKDGRLFMLMNTKMNQLRDNLTRSSAFMLKETSM
jgi:hypothetical protein